MIVTDATDAENGELLRVLYQLPFDGDALPEFVGGTGFTGLHYIRNGAAQLQVWCGAAA